jgi:hypothetical protein
MIVGEDNIPPGYSDGSGEIYIRVAAITLALAYDAPRLKPRIFPPTDAFLVEQAVPDITVRTTWRELADEVAGQKLFDSGALWQLYRDNGNYIFRFASPHFGPAPYKIASFDDNFTTGEVHLSRRYFDPDEPVYPLEYPLDELIMMNLLARGRGVEVHSSGILDITGKGYIFAGQSGAGKTTMACLWDRREGVEVLSDDRIIIRNLEERYSMYGTPWHGEARLACSTGAELAAIFFLARGQKNELIEQSRAQAAARLLACGFPPFFDPKGLEFTLEFYEGLTSRIPCYELRVVPDDSVIDFIRSHVG